MAESVVALVSQWLVSLLKLEADTLFNVADEVKGLQQELELMQAYLRDADARQEEKEVSTLISQIRKLVYDVEDVIDTYILKVPASTERHMLKRFGRFLYNAPQIYKLGKQMIVMQRDLERMTTKLDSCGLTKIAPELKEGFRKLHKEGYWRAPSYSFEDNSCHYVVGLEKDVSKLLEVLIGEGNTHINILSIIGMGGSGKTTLARKLYNHPFVKECFNGMAWVFISQEWSTRHTLLEILRMVGGQGGTYELHAKLSAEALVDKLRGVLKKKSYLIVLDDVWRREALEEILPALPLGDVNKDSKIIITTRNREVVNFQNLRQLFVHEPQPLSKEEGWELFSKLALGHRTDCNMENFKSLGMVMLKNCGGLPLAIVALGGILKSRGSIGEWQHMNEAIKVRLMKGLGSNTHGSVQKLLALSYEDLPYYLKHCFLYLCLFPEDCQIPAGMLTRMWIAEGLITSSEEISPEDVALQYLEELSNRCMIQVVRTNFKGAIKAFHLHDLLRDLCLKIAKEQSFLQICKNNQSMTTFASTMAVPPPRRVSLQSSISLPTQDSNLRSLILLTRSSLLQSAKVHKETVDLKLVQNKFQLLRLLNFWGIKTDDGALPKEIGSLIHLRYLGIRDSNIIELPHSIGNLRNLTTLDYRKIDSVNSVQIKIPNVLWKLVQLRHLFLPIECVWNTHEELHLSGLENLQILWGIRANGGDWFSREIVNLSMTLKKLKVVVSTQKDLEATFSCPNLKSHQLHTFQCQWGDGIVLGHVNPIFAHNHHLSKLVLIGPVLVKDFSLILPSNLVILELKESVVDYEDPMAAIGALAHLKLLRLSNAYMGTTFKCKIGSFPMLEEFHLENLHKLSKWVIEEGAMQSLKTVQISGCRKLQHLPQGLEFVRTLQVLEFIGVPKSFVKEATECGWSRKKLRLPHTIDAIIEQCDSPVDFSSISKLYEQLRAGVFLNEKKQKYWVLKQNERYHNCFMLYATFLSSGLSGRLVSDEFDLDYDEGCWEWIDVKESDGALMTVLKINYHSYDFGVSGEFLVNNLSPQVTYHVVCVIMLPESAQTVPFYRASSKITFPDQRSQQKNLNTGGMPRGKWIRLPIGDYDTPPKNRGRKRVNFSLSFGEPGLLIQGVIIEPKL